MNDGINYGLKTGEKFGLFVYWAIVRHPEDKFSDEDIDQIIRAEFPRREEALGGGGAAYQPIPSHRSYVHNNPGKLGVRTDAIAAGVLKRIDALFPSTFSGLPIPMNSILFSTNPKLATMEDAILHLQTHSELYFEVKFRIKKETFTFPIAGFMHVSKDKVRGVACITDIVPFSKDHFENPAAKPQRWLKEWQENTDDIRSNHRWKYALVVTRIDPYEAYAESFRKDPDGNPVTHPPRQYYKVLPPKAWPGFGSLPQETQEVSDLAAPPERILTTGYRIDRDTEIARSVKALHRYECQLCGYTIELPGGRRYAEGHHIRPLGNPHVGPDVCGNIMCVCPNHHAALDLGVIPISGPAIRSAAGHVIDQKYIDYHNEIIHREGRGSEVQELGDSSSVTTRQHVAQKPDKAENL